jgi:hypothetical protein
VGPETRQAPVRAAIAVQTAIRRVNDFLRVRGAQYGLPGYLLGIGMMD